MLRSAWLSRSSLHEHNEFRNAAFHSRCRAPSPAEYGRRPSCRRGSAAIVVAGPFPTMLLHYTDAWRQDFGS